MRIQQPSAGVWFYGAGTLLTGILTLAWRNFDPAHQPFQSLGKIPGQGVIACIVGLFLVATGLAVVWRRRASLGAAASAIAYLGFVALWLPRYYAGMFGPGSRVNIFTGASFGLAQQIMLLAPAVILYASAADQKSLFQKGTFTAARWMLGLPSVFFGICHLVVLRGFAPIVPQWIGFGYFWAGITGVAFILAGVAICTGIKDVLAARLLALMLLLFEGLVEIPPIFVRLHDQATWGAAVYNVTAIGACLIFAESLVSRANRERVDTAEDLTISRPDQAVA
jgi:uncharacterized membrane protein